MSSRMDKYKSEEVIPSRSTKNKELYKQIYNAYDNFENLVVPSNSREITMSELKKEITSREEYRSNKEDKEENNQIIKREKIREKEQEENISYDINELLNKALTSSKQKEKKETNITNGDYLKKLNLDNRRTNIEQVKEIYDELKEEAKEEGDESLIRTANLSLEILSDLKSDSDSTKVVAPIKNEELPESEMDFYSNNYKFNKRDFEDKEYEREEYDDEDESSNGKLFLKVLMLVFGILLMVIVLVYFVKFFNQV